MLGSYGISLPTLANCAMLDVILIIIGGEGIKVGNIGNSPFPMLFIPKYWFHPLLPDLLFENDIQVETVADLFNKAVEKHRYQMENLIGMTWQMY